MKEDLERWLKQVLSSSQKSHGKVELVSRLERIIESNPEYESSNEERNSSGVIQTSKVFRGDVFIHKLVGGKVRPWITLGVFTGYVNAISMSSSNCIPMCQASKCRFWPDSWICPTISLISIEDATKRVTRPYTNIEHIEEFEKFMSKVMAGTPLIEKEGK